MSIPLKEFEADLRKAADDIQNKTIESCARIAEAYGAPAEAVQAILRLKCKERTAA
jgi:hypothetical protein